MAARGGDQLVVQPQQTETSLRTNHVQLRHDRCVSRGRACALRLADGGTCQREARESCTEEGIRPRAGLRSVWPSPLHLEIVDRTPDILEDVRAGRRRSRTMSAVSEGSRRVAAAEEPQNIIRLQPSLSHAERPQGEPGRRR